MSPTRRPCSFPLANVDGVGLRRAIADDEVERLFKLLGDGKIDNQQNWKGRFKDNSDKMRSGSIYDVADVLKSLTFLTKSKSLSFREKRMLDRARFLSSRRFPRWCASRRRRSKSAWTTRSNHSLTARNRAEARGKVTVKPIAAPPRVALHVPPVAPRRAVRAS